MESKNNNKTHTEHTHKLIDTGNKLGIARGRDGVGW